MMGIGYWGDELASETDRWADNKGQAIYDRLTKGEAGGGNWVVGGGRVGFVGGCMLLIR